MHVDKGWDGVLRTGRAVFGPGARPGGIARGGGRGDGVRGPLALYPPPRFICQKSRLPALLAIKCTFPRLLQDTTSLFWL